MARPYAKRLKIPIYPREDGCRWNTPLFSRSGLKVADGYRRVVIGKRGPYVEFHLQDIHWTVFYVPEAEEYRIKSGTVFYEEWRTYDSSYVKLYLQKKTVAYADYKVSMCYISPFDLVDDLRSLIIE